MKSNFKKDTFLGNEVLEVFESPTSEITPNKRMGIERIILHTNYTHVDFVYIASKKYLNGGWIQLHQDCFLRLSGTEVEYKMIEAIAIPIAPSKLHFNAAGQVHHFSELKYVISNIRLVKDNGDEVPYNVNDLDKGAAVIDQAKTASLSYVLSNVPSASYKQIKFGLGIKPEQNTLDQVRFPNFYAQISKSI